MNLRDAAQKALEALEIAMRTPINEYLPREPLDAIDALRAALADTQDWDEIEALRESLREHMAEILRLRAAGRQALDALENHTQEAERIGRIAVGINALRATLSWDAMQRLTDVQQQMERPADTGKTSDHIPDVGEMVASVREDRTVEPVAYVTGYSKGYAVVQPVDRSLLMCVGMALYRSPPKREPVATLNEMETVEPVAYIHETGFLVRTPGATLTPGMKLYPAPPKRKPLTEEEIIECVAEVDDARLAGPITALIRAIERAHGIGGEE